MKLPHDVTYDYPYMVSLYYDPTVRDRHSTQDLSLVGHALKDEIHRALEEVVSLRQLVDDQAEEILQLQNQISQLESELSYSQRSSGLLAEAIQEITEKQDAQIKRTCNG